MRRPQTLLTIVALLLSGLVGAQIGQAARTPRQLLPIVQSSPPITAQIYTCQCGAVLAKVRSDGTVLLTILDHSRGGLIVVGIDDGQTFHELSTSIPTQAAADAPAPAPAFQFPGDKQGIGDTVEAFGRMVTYAPNRVEDGGSYNIWRFVYAAPLK